MKLLAILLTLSGLSALLTGCALGPENTKDYDNADFDTVEVSDGFHVQVIPDTSYSISITANADLFRYITVSQEGKTLKIGIDGISFYPGATLKAVIRLPELKGLNLSGAVRATALGFKTTDNFTLHASGASRADIDLETARFTADISGASTAKGVLKATESRIHISGASRAELNGSGGKMTLDASGASSAELSSLEIGDANIELSGASHGNIKTDARLDVDISGGSTLEYSGNPVTGNLDISGGSNMRRK